MQIPARHDSAETIVRRHRQSEGLHPLMLKSAQFINPDAHHPLANGRAKLDKDWRAGC